MESTVWPPIIKARDSVLPERRGGATMVADLDRHFGEIVGILRSEPRLLLDVIRYSTAMAPLIRALAGQTIPADDSLSSHTSARLRPGMVEWTAELLRRFAPKASTALKATIARYAAVLPSLQNLTPDELLDALDDRRLVSRLEAP